MTGEIRGPITHRTVGDLREKIKDLPDDMPLLTIDGYDRGNPVHTIGVDIVKPGDLRRCETWLTPEEFAEHCDENGKLLPGGPYTEKSRPPKDGLRALTFWP